MAGMCVVVYGDEIHCSLRGTYYNQHMTRDYLWTCAGVLGWTSAKFPGVGRLGGGGRADGVTPNCPTMSERGAPGQSCPPSSGIGLSRSFHPRLHGKGSTLVVREKDRPIVEFEISVLLFDAPRVMHYHIRYQCLVQSAEWLCLNSCHSLIRPRYIIKPMFGKLWNGRAPNSLFHNKLFFGECFSYQVKKIINKLKKYCTTVWFGDCFKHRYHKTSMF